MVYIHVKKVGNKQYYTLRVSYRNNNGNVLTKDLENLGTDISKISIEMLEKKYKKEVRESYRGLQRFLESEYYINKARKTKFKQNNFFTKEQREEIEATNFHFHRKFSSLDKLTKKEIFEMFLIKFAVSSTSIEGNTITLSEARRLFQENILPKNKTLREVYDLQNTKTVFFDLLERKPDVTAEVIAKVHDALLQNIDLRLGYRNHDIRILGEPFSPTPARYVKDDIKLLIEWYRKQRKNMHPLALAIFFHHKFENIHPFSDGNGRTGRMIMNLILIKENYAPFIILATQRKEYLAAMNEADQAIKKDLFSIDMKDYSKLFTFCTEQYTKTYWNTFLV
ncbi:Fic family protein [Candidatus Woesearchaeota archaeon]|nr:Fic family protein [Candidatus Woesearchaeota archaeon]